MTDMYVLLFPRPLSAVFPFVVRRLFFRVEFDSVRQVEKKEREGKGKGKGKRQREKGVRGKRFNQSRHQTRYKSNTQQRNTTPILSRLDHHVTFIAL